MRSAYRLGWCLPLVIAAAGRAQCDIEWLPGDGYPGVLGAVEVMHEWDPDGAGPEAPLLVMGGDLSLAGDQVVRNLGAWDPVTGAWKGIGGGLDGPVQGLATLATGELLVVGAFSEAGTVPAANLAVWDGSAWSTLGSGTNGAVLSVLVRASGDVVIGGVFSTAGGVAAERVATWDGVGWSALDTGCNDSVLALAEDASGELLVGGEFTLAGGLAADRLARWDGTSWAEVGGGVTGFSSVFVRALLPLPNGDLFVGGRFTTVQGMTIPSLARWDGSAWSPVGSGLSDDVLSLSLASNGDVIAAGPFLSSGTQSTPGVARWDGAVWSALGSGIELGADVAIGLSNGDVVAAGAFDDAGGVPAFRIARWDGLAWSRMADGFNGGIASIARLSNGDVVVGGRFKIAGDVATENVALFDGTNWSALGTGVGGPPFFLSPSVLAVAVLPNDDIVVGGDFSEAGGVTAGNLALWDGVSWSPLLGSANGIVDSLVVMPSGDLVVGGAFTMVGGIAANGIARWDGVAWSALGTGMAGGLFGSVVSDMAVLPNGDLVAVGRFATSGGLPTNGVARWDGVSWSAFDTGLSLAVPFVGLSSVDVLPDGDVVVGGLFALPQSTVFTNVARWTGSAWVDIGNTGTTPAQELHALPNGDLLGAFGVVDNGSGTGAPFHLSRYDGVDWVAFGQDADAGIADIQRAPDGTLLLGGSFTSGGGLVSASFARVQSTCSATAVVAGAGCPSSGGANDLQPTGLPWVGTTFVAEAVGMPSLALVASVVGFAPTALPLASILAEAGPGCTLWAAPDVLGFVIPVAGSATTMIALPNSAALAGTQLYHQLIPFEVTPAIAIVEITATNALELTIGFL